MAIGFTLQIDSDFTRSDLAQIRFQAAAQLLSTTELPVAEVSARVGYQAEEAFSRAFKRHFGVAPSEFRHTAPAQP